MLRSGSHNGSVTQSTKRRFPSTLVTPARVMICLAGTLWCTGAWTATFTPLGDLSGGAFESAATGISADGSVVVGRSRSGSGLEAFRWSMGTMSGLSFLGGDPVTSQAFGISADGSVIFGQSSSDSGPQAFRWTSGGGMAGLGDLSGGGFNSLAGAASSDGSVIVGLGTTATGQEAFRWTTGGLVGLGNLGGSANFSRATGTSADGVVMVGGSSSPVSSSGSGAEPDREAFRQSSDPDRGPVVMTGIGDLDGGAFSSFATAVTPDGNTIVGTSVSAAGREAFRWTASGGMVGLGDLPGGATEARARAVSQSGIVIVGQGATAAGDTAFVWTAAGGMMPLLDVLLSQGLSDQLSDWSLTDATAVSASGLVIAGTGVDPFGRTQAWVASLNASFIPVPAALPLFLSALGIVGLLRWRKRAIN